MATPQEALSAAQASWKAGDVEGFTMLGLLVQLGTVPAPA